MKDILIITNYFPPEIGAASNRIFHLAEGLQKHGYKVTVITPLPNYPKGEIFKAYKGQFKHTSNENNITVHRLWLYASNSKNKLLRLFAMLSYSFSLIWFFMWHNIPHKVIIQSPPLLVAFTSMLCLRSKKRKIILNVSDLWPLAGLELGAFKKNFSYRILKKIERFNYKYADLILGQDFDASLPNQKVDASKKLKMVYAGLLGVAQGILKLCMELDYRNVQFHIYGAGAEQGAIQQLINKRPDLDIIYHGEVSRIELHEKLMTYNFTIIPLLHRIYGSVPSKIFEYARLGIPMLYFGGGEGENLITRYNLGWAAEPSNYNQLNAVIANIDLTKLQFENRKNIQKIAFENFDFNTQFVQLVEVI